MYTFEAVAYDETERPFGRMIQQIIAPFWFFAMPGCKAGNINANKILTDAGFDTSHLQTHFAPNGPIQMKDTMWGVAVKR